MRKIFLILSLVSVVGFVLLGSPQEAPYLEVELVEAVAQGQVRCTVIAQGTLAHVTLRLYNPGPQALRVLIIPGTLFVPPDPVYQIMGVIEVVAAVLRPGEEREVLVPTACFEMDRRGPTEGMILTIARSSDAEQLTRLIHSPTFQQASFRVRQFAIWTLLARPASPEDYVGLGLGQEFVEALEDLGVPVELLVYFYFMPESVYELSEEDIEMLAFVFTLAGIPVESADDLYRLFSTGGPTKGELAQVRQIFQEAGLPLEDFPALNLG
ncbi:MAG: hypothetical protein NZ651_04375 [Candidatus Bipolaricaulota bacterium]|nr:hypothetical protein [Candidatus Bipolaricaulota bacterium]MDW8126987.1 hypothetical protein [Candidatus Bipolaricaulota bacterium]